MALKFIILVFTTEIMKKFSQIVGLKAESAAEKIKIDKEVVDELHAEGPEKVGE